MFRFVSPISGVWKSKDYDYPIIILGYAVDQRDGKKWYFIKGSKSFIIEDEVEIK